ncbi:MAG TPA: hypothetical protein VLO07_08860 [Thermoanaerobaculia bacterium]|nr:hypothetical protein [Thermoanaerobaculia bacterium]
MAATLDLAVSLAHERWRKAVDNLWREVLFAQQAKLEERERERCRRCLKNLRRIVRKALAEYHRLELDRQAKS